MKPDVLNVLKHIGYTLLASLCSGGIAALSSPAVQSFIENHPGAALFAAVLIPVVTGLLVTAEKWSKASSV